jgi:CRISPR/Cas system-associated endonuclease Cas1
LRVSACGLQSVQSRVDAHSASKEFKAIEVLRDVVSWALDSLDFGYQERKRETLTHPLLEQSLRIGQLPFIQARVLARHLRGDLPDYIPFVPK